MKYHGNEYFEAVWCNEFNLAMQAACKHWEKQLGVFLIAGLWTLRGMKQERFFWSKAEIFVISVGLDDIERVLDWSVRYEKDKVMIASVLDGMEVCFNPCSGKVEDSTGRRCLVSVPDITIVYPQTKGVKRGY